jgi:diguanylate cyclase (GGDEF)-like protein/PAS domain S-box-containing protein
MQNANQSAHTLDVALRALPVGISWAYLADLKIAFVNRKFTEIFGYQVDDFTSVREWIETVYPFPEDRTLAQQKWEDYFASPGQSDFEVESMEVRIRCKDGNVKTVLHSGIILPETGWALATFVDITDRKRDELLLQAAERQARENKAIYSLLLNHSPEMIVLSPFDRTRRYVSPAVKRVTGFTAEEYLALGELEMIHPEDREPFREAIAVLAGEERSHAFRYRALQKKDGYRWVECVMHSYTDPNPTQPAGYIAFIRDITEQKRHEDRLASEYKELAASASLDELTGIANRRVFNQVLQKEGMRHSHRARDLSLLLLDVDLFKQYNDHYGHIPGDICLTRVAETLQRILRRETDLVARYGGEEFVILLPMTDACGAEMIAQSILEALSELAIPHLSSPMGLSA